MCAIRGIYKLTGDTETVARLPYTAFEYVANPQLPPNQTDIDGFSLVREGGVSSDYEQAAVTRQGRDNVLDQPIDKIFLLGIAAHVLERQHGDRRLVGNRQDGSEGRR